MGAQGRSENTMFILQINQTSERSYQTPRSPESVETSETGAWLFTLTSEAHLNLLKINMATKTFLNDLVFSLGTQYTHT